MGNFLRHRRGAPIQFRDWSESCFENTRGCPRATKYGTGFVNGISSVSDTSTPSGATEPHESGSLLHQPTP